ncbi:hypothetical protein LSCM1_01797 [Leishmania martiniquensis]|uniref:Uncharacterized protein n=1 Tax=Leishmania martiniquensis TaxID=1580590 RepID=A0A836GVG0_9TRYP|nr:hypothetical protein LSCM1_01797 [Leishmania martiniquensis]
MSPLTKQAVRLPPFFAHRHTLTHESDKRAVMSPSTAPPTITCFGHFHVAHEEASVKEPGRITHLIPILEVLHIRDAETAGESSAVMAAVRRLREGAGHDSVQVHTIRWRGETETSIRAQLRPVLVHYRLQILFVKERTQRRVLECQELNERVPLVTEYYQATPLKWRLIGPRSNRACVGNLEPESVLSSAASVVTSVSEARREQQFRETFERFESALQHRDTVSGASSAVRARAGSFSDFSAYEDRGRMPSSPPPRVPLGQCAPVPMDASVEDDALGTTVAYADLVYHA